MPIALAAHGFYGVPIARGPRAKQIGKCLKLSLRPVVPELELRDPMDGVQLDTVLAFVFENTCEQEVVIQVPAEGSEAGFNFTRSWTRVVGPSSDCVSTYGPGMFTVPLFADAVLALGPGQAAIQISGGYGLYARCAGDYKFRVRLSFDPRAGLGPTYAEHDEATVQRLREAKPVTLHSKPVVIRVVDPKD